MNCYGSETLLLHSLRDSVLFCLLTVLGGGGQAWAQTSNLLPPPEQQGFQLTYRPGFQELNLLLEGKAST